MQAIPQAIPSEASNPGVDNRLGEFARELAKRHAVDPLLHQKSDLLERLQSWEQALRNANAIFKGVPSKDLPVSRAAEWMLDNFYVVKQTFNQITEGLPYSFLDQLPKLSGAPQESGLPRPAPTKTVGTLLEPGLPRIFALAEEWVEYCQSQIELNQTGAFVQEYQQVAPLTIGELWALPIMLRIGILEQLVYATTELTGMDTVSRIRTGIAPTPAGSRTGSRSANQVDSTAAANDSIVANCFTSLRLLSANDWKDFFEQTSRVEQILREDPAGIYTSMDFDTRNNYRSVIEELSRHSAFSEEQVARTAITFAGSTDAESAGRKSHVGYYLLDAGRSTLEASLHYQPEAGVRVRRALLAHPTFTYLGSIAFFSAVFVLGLLAYTKFSGGSLAQDILAGLLGFGLALEAAISLVNWNVTHRIKPQSLPRMDFSEGIPSGNRCMVVVPALLENATEISHLLQEMELRYLSNQDPQLTYALLTDFGDATAQNMPEDESLLAMARAGIEALNKKYSQRLPFYLFHRQREWNASEGVWMGWERKRGKLAEFNCLLLGLGETSYTNQVGDAGILSNIKYVITLDADTSLPQGSANRLVATLAHPLNQAEFAIDGCSVVAGYTVLQPRVATKPTSANRSRFSQIFSGNAGFDLYSFAVSDVYQDLFGEGSYVGKGIYDVAAFERSLAGQVRENTLLSHDLFEGIYGRAALVTDIVLYEEYPGRYLGYAQRLQRWIRGDWQLLPWLLPFVRTESGIARNRLATIDIWKVFDNLRRSLLPPTLLALLAAGWLVLPGSPLAWTLLVLLPAALPIASQVIWDGLHNFGRLTLKQIFEPTWIPLTRWALGIVFLPYEALLMLNAIGTTLIRLLVARKNLLQWTTAANAARLSGLNKRYETWVSMSASLFLTVLLGTATAFFHPAALWVATPVLAVWLFAPQFAVVLSRPVIHTSAPLSETQRRQVRRLARRTWAFFEQFSGPDDHWLPPDHYQESPRGSVEHYTTPTNIGLFLVSTLSAFDLGYMGLPELAVRLRSTFESLEKLEHYRGHLLNWYDSGKVGRAATALHLHGG